MLLETAAGFVVGSASPGAKPADEDLVSVDAERAVEFMYLARTEGGQVHRLPACETVRRAYQHAVAEPTQTYRRAVDRVDAAARLAREARRQRLRAPRSEWS